MATRAQLGVVRGTNYTGGRKKKSLPKWYAFTWNSVIFIFCCLNFSLVPQAVCYHISILQEVPHVD